LNADGSFNRAYAKYSTPVRINDRDGINEAQVIAEERAKGKIIEFLSQRGIVSTIVTEIRNSVNKVTQEQQTASPTTIKNIDLRSFDRTLTQVNASFASGTLTGVVVLENGYSPEKQEAWVVVGVSQKTIDAARTLQDALAGPKRADSAPTTNDQIVR